jgi:hypothetical protein
MKLKWRIEAITAEKIEPVFPADARDAGIRFRALVAKIAAADPVLGPDFIARGRRSASHRPGRRGRRAC